MQWKSLGLPPLGIVIKHINNIHRAMVLLFGSCHLAWQNLEEGLHFQKLCSGSALKYKTRWILSLHKCFPRLTFHLRWLLVLRTFTDILHLTTWSKGGAFVSWSHLCWNSIHLMVLCVLTSKMYLNWMSRKYFRYLIVLNGESICRCFTV